MVFTEEKPLYLSYRFDTSGQKNMTFPRQKTHIHKYLASRFSWTEYRKCKKVSKEMSLCSVRNPVLKEASTEKKECVNNNNDVSHGYKITCSKTCIGAR